MFPFGWLVQRIKSYGQIKQPSIYLLPLPRSGAAELTIASHFVFVRSPYSTLIFTRLDSCIDGSASKALAHSGCLVM